MSQTELPQEPLQDLETHAVELAWGAGRILLERFRRPLKVEYKTRGKRNPVTDADEASEEFLRQGIVERFPGHGVLGEEGAGKDSEPREITWALDPLDGTTNFLNGLPVFAVSIGVLHCGNPVAAAVFLPWACPEEGQVLHARRGGGAFVGDRPLSVAQRGRPQAVGLTGMPAWYRRGFALKGELRRQVGEVRAVGSIAYELALTASGVFQYAVIGGSQVWDVAAGLLLVEEAGGLVVARRGRRWERMESFASPGGPGVPGQEELRGWRAPLIAGSPDMVRFVAAHLTPRRRLLRRLVRRIRRMVESRHP